MAAFQDLENTSTYKTYIKYIFWSINDIISNILPVWVGYFTGDKSKVYNIQHVNKWKRDNYLGGSGFDWKKAQICVTIKVCLNIKNQHINNRLIQK